jgi:hypothetical protein
LTYVELSPVCGAGAMQRNHLGSEKVLAIGNAFRDVNNLAPLVVDHIVRGPFPVAVTALLNLEPAQCQSYFVV